MLHKKKKRRDINPESDWGAIMKISKIRWALLVLCFTTVGVFAQRTASGYQSGVPAAPAPMGWVFTDANGAMGVAYNDGWEFDAVGQVPHTEVNGSGHLTYINPNATTGASGQSWDRVDFDVPNLGFGQLNWTLNVNATMYAMSQGFTPLQSPYPPPQYVNAESIGVLAVWGNFSASQGAARVTDDFGWVTYAASFGCVDMGWTLPNGLMATFPGGANTGYRFMHPEFVQSNPQTYNPNIAQFSLAVNQSVANQVGCGFGYYSVGFVRVDNHRGDTFMEATYRSETNSYGTKTWYGTIKATEPPAIGPGGARPRTWTWQLR